MSEVTEYDVFLGNTSVSITPEQNNNIEFMTLLSIVISSVGMIANLTVVIVFLRHKVLRQKVPIIFVINQVTKMFIYFSQFCSRKQSFMFHIGKF